MRWLILVAVIGIAACESPNPRSCADGICNDQSFPFCDVDGQLAGHPLTCIAVACMPGDFAECRGDSAITCNAMGNDYDVTKCERGCSDAAGGCNACTMNSDCANPTPFCDLQSHGCRACQRDDECASQVCDVGSGSCVAETAIVYAAPTGASTGSCTQQQPCSTARAVQVATTAATTPALLLTAGSYTTALQITTATAGPLQIVGHQAAFVGGITPIQVSGGANVHVRGIQATTSGGVTCGTPTGASSSITLTDSTIVTTSAATPASLDAVNCSVVLSRDDISFTSGDFAIQLADNTSLRADQLRVHADGTAFLVTKGKGVDGQITNSLFENAALVLSTTDTVAPGSQLLFSYSTFEVSEQTYPLPCNWTTEIRAVTFSNSIVRSHGTGPAIQGVQCTFVNSIASPSNFSPSGAMVVDPQLVDAANHDFHLKPTSPAIDIGTSSSDPNLTHDLDGTARPQGSKLDLGALEYHP